MEEPMKGFCPSCEKESELTRIQRVENLTVKGESIPVDVDYFACAECGEEFDNPDPTYDPLALAYQEYRRRKDMIQPEEIRALREKYGLTQRELSDLLGFGGATLSRYENGALQDETHDTILRLIMEPQNLLDVVQQKPHAFDALKRERLVQQLQNEIGRAELLFFLKRRPHYRTANPLNGFREIDLNRLLSAIKVLCYLSNVYKTKLNKLLFYADFKHFKEYGASITGLCYAHLPLGPVPDQFEPLFQRLTELDPTLINEEDTSLDCAAEYFRCNTAPDTTTLSFTEIQVLIQVRDHFRYYSARQIKDYSHDEEGYKQTSKSEIISYEFAKSLRV